MLKIWGRKNSINVQKVMSAVGELAIPAAALPFNWRKAALRGIPLSGTTRPRAHTHPKLHMTSPQ
jgi:hypothetical protein